MKIERLEIEYFMCFGPKVVLEFPESFNIMVAGFWESQPNRSNWSGKSTLLEAIKFLLYGETRNKYLKEIPNDHYGKPARVAGIINVGGERLEITRTVEKNSSTLSVEGWESQDKKVLQSRLNDKLGYSYNDFICTCFFNQGDINQFMEAKPADKLSLLERWMEIADWNGCESIAKEEKKWVEDKLQGIQSLLSRKEYVRDKVKEERDVIERVKNKLQQLKTQEKDLQTEIEELQSKLAERKSAKALAKRRKELEEKLLKSGSTVELQRELASKRNELKKLKEEIEQGKKEVKDLPKIQQKRIAAETELTRYNTKLQEVEAEATSLRKLIKKIGDANVCMIDGRRCTRASEIQQFKKKKTTELKLQSRMIERLTTEVNSLASEHSKKELAIAQLKETVRDIERSELKLDTLRAEIRAIKEKLNSAESTEKELTEIKESVGKKSRRKLLDTLEELKNKRSKLHSEIEEKSEELGAHRQSALSLRSQLVTMTRNEKKAEVYSRRKEILSFCTYMFGRNGIRSSQLKSRIESIEQETNEILDELDCKLQIEIHTERELTSWEPFCVFCGREFPRGYSKRRCDSCDNVRQKKRKEEFDIKILNQGKTRGFNQESGGAKLLVSLAIRLSLVKLRQRITGKSIDLLFLDEIYGMLDGVNRENVYVLLLDYAQNKLGFKQIFQITHIFDGFSDVMRLEIVRKRKHSEVRWA